MEVTLKIEAGQLGETVVDLFKTLSEDQKMQIAKEVVEKWFLEDPTAERAAFSDKKVRELRQQRIRINYGDKYSDTASDVEIKTMSEYRSAMQNFMSSREQMVSKAVAAAVQQYQDSVKTLVSEDPGLKAAFETVREKIEENFPQMIQQAVIGWFKNMMSNIVMNVPGDLYSMKDEIMQMQNKINEIALKQNGYSA